MDVTRGGCGEVDVTVGEDVVKRVSGKDLITE